MGFLIVTVVGAILGWLAAILIDRDDRVGTALCAAIGLIGAVIGAGLAGDVALARGVSADQLLSSVVGAVVAITVTNTLLVQCLSRGLAEKIDNRIGRRHHRGRPF